MNILITRPEPEASRLAHALTQAGHEVVNLPLLNIEVQAGELDLAHRDFIFVSKNAVRGVKNLAGLQGKTVFAVGPGTARLLLNEGIEVIYPQTAGGAEALLALPELQQVQGRHFIVVCGDQARTEIAETLTRRGAQVEAVCVYTSHRQLLSPAQRLLLQQPYDLVVMTSLDALRYAIECGISPHAQLTLLSQNMLQCAQDYGFMRFVKLQYANEAEILYSINQP